MTPEKVIEVQKYGREPISLHTPLGGDGDSEFGDLIEDSEAIQPGEAVSFTLLQEQLHSVLDTLSEPERPGGLRYGSSYQRQPKTLDEIDNIYGVTQEGTRQMKSKTMSNCATRPDPTSCGTTSTDPTDGRQPPDVTSGPRPARGRTECPQLDGQHRDRHRAENPRNWAAPRAPSGFHHAP